MDDVSNSNSKTDCDSSEAQPLSVGGMLGKAREDLGLSVADVEKRLKFTPRQIQALEADDFNYLQDIHFVRRFVHGYARLVQLEPAHLLALLPEAPGIDGGGWMGRCLVGWCVVGKFSGLTWVHPTIPMSV